MTQKTCLDCHYVVKSRDAFGITWHSCSHPDHRDGRLPYPRCEDFTEKDEETEIFQVVRR